MSDDRYASLRDKVVLVAGVGPGFGNELVATLARHGARVVFGARTKTSLDALGADVRASGGVCAWLPTDITDAAQVGALVELARREFGGLDGVVNTPRARTRYLPLAEDDLAEWRASYEVNLFGPLCVSQAAIPLLRERGGGSIVMVNSMIVRRPLANYGAYTSAKAALFSAAQVLALELGPYRIRVNSVLPGYMDGPSLEQFFEASAQRTGVTAQQARATATARTALGRLPTFHDCVSTVLFLLSDSASAITGQSIDVNAGEVFA